MLQQLSSPSLRLSWHKVMLLSIALVVLYFSLFLACSPPVTPAPSENTNEASPEEFHSVSDSTSQDMAVESQALESNLPTESVSESGDTGATEQTPLPEESPKEVPPAESNTPEQPSEVDGTHVESGLPEQTTGTVTATITQAQDIVTSYLLSGSSWNYFFGKTVPLGRHFNTGNPSYFTAFRFRSLAIPQGVQIQSATLSWYPHNETDSSKNLMINIYAEKSDNSASFDPTNYTSNRPDQRSRTTAKIDRWIVRCRDDCSSDVASPQYEYDCPQRKKDCWDRQTRYSVPKDLKTVVQEVISQPTWKPGHALTIFLFNAATDQDGSKYQSSRTIIGFDETQLPHAPQLEIHYQP